MGKVKIKKKSTWIDMTPMSDVMVLLLTFFMLTSTFVKNEPVKVVTPGSVSEIKVPEKSVLNILVDKTGKIFMSMDNQNDTQAVLEGMSELYGMKFTPQQVNKFKKRRHVGSSDELYPTISLAIGNRNGSNTQELWHSYRQYRR